MAFISVHIEATSHRDMPRVVPAFLKCAANLNVVVIGASVVGAYPPSGSSTRWRFTLKVEIASSDEMYPESQALLGCDGLVLPDKE